MTYDPRKTIDAPGTSPDRGMNAKNYIVIIIIAVVVLLGLIAVFALGGGTSSASDHKGPTPATQPTGPAPQ